MKLIPAVGTGLEIEEENNVVTISSESWKNAVDLVIQVPSASNLELSSTNDGDIVVENVSGTIEVGNVNGSNTLKNVSGNVVAQHRQRGDPGTDVPGDAGQAHVLQHDERGHRRDLPGRRQGRRSG